MPRGPQKVKGVGAKDALAVQARQLDATLREDALRQKKGRFEAELKVHPFKVFHLYTVLGIRISA